MTLTRRISGEGRFDEQNQGLDVQGRFAPLLSDLLPSRAVESMLQAGHSDVVLVDTMDELPNLADVQVAHLRLRALCLPGESNLWPFTPTPRSVDPNLICPFSLL